MLRPRGRLTALLVVLAGCQPDVTAPPNPPQIAALFDPTANPPVVPTPNDLAFRGGDGKHLAIMDLPTDSPAQRDFNAYLRELDGFPPSSTASSAFSGPLDPATVQPPSAGAPGSVLVIDTMTGSVLDAAAVQTGLSEDGTRIVITPARRWQSGHRYAALVLGGADPAGVRGAGGERVVASRSFFLLRAATPLIARCLDVAHPDCACAEVADPACHSIVRGVDDTVARAAETERRMIDPGLTTLLGLVGRARGDVVQLWTFTIASLPIAVFDLPRAELPFPNDLLIDQTIGRVNLPIAPGDPQAALKMKLNTLDGFSVSAPITAMVDLPEGGGLDAATLQPGGTVALVNLDPRPGAVQPTFAATAPAPNTIALQPLEALLSDQNRYGVVLSRAVGDVAGNSVMPPPTMVLIRGAHPLFDGTHSTVNVLTDAQAALLEPLRVAFQPFVERLGMVGLPREQIVLAWTFTTQSIVRPLLAVDAFPTRNLLPTDVTLTRVVAEAELSAKAATLPFPTANMKAIVLGTFPSEDVIDRTASQVLFDRSPTGAMVPQADLFAVHVPPGDPPTALRFWLSLPKSPASASGAPVVVLQHGFTSWRGDMLALADGFAEAGWAAIAFDIDLHGSRTRCTDDTQCNAGSCTQGVCASGLRPKALATSPLACSVQALSGDPADCNPMASGGAFITPADLFMVRANLHAYVLDAAQLMRVLDAATVRSLDGQLRALPEGLGIDRGRVAFLGHSLGAIAGTLFAAVDAAPRTVVLNGGGAHAFDALASGPTARWVLDAVDPWSVGRHLQRAPLPSYVTGTVNPPKPTIVQELGMDTVIPAPFQQALGEAVLGPAGLDAMHHLVGRQRDGAAASTSFPTAAHGTLVSGQPMVEGVPMRVQAKTFIVSGGASLPAAR